MIEKRGVLTAILFTIITCGIYGVFWMANLSNDISTYLGERRRGWKEVLFTFITCGLYSIYWNYSKGKKIADAQEKAGVRVRDNSLIYLIASFFAVTAAIPMWVMQDDMNTIIEKTQQ